MANAQIASTALFLTLASWLIAAPATGDTFFGDAQVVTDASPLQNHLYAAAAAGDALFLAGMDAVPGAGRWRVEKRNLVDGALVPEFGAGGVLTVDPSADWDRVTAIAVDGRHLFLVGETAGSLRIEKRTADEGRLRKNFGTGGVVTIPGENAVWESANSVLVVGAHLYVATSVGRIHKLRTIDGSLDERFRPSTLPAGDAKVASLAVGANALFSGAGTSLGFRFEKRGLQNGRLLWQVDDAFGRVGCGLEAPYALAVDGSAVFVGGMHLGGWRLERRRARDGALLWHVDVPSTGHCDVVNDLIVLGDELIAVGTRAGQRRIEKRRLDDGALVAEFGLFGGGIVIGPSNVRSTAAVTSACGTLFVASTAGGPGETWFTARVHATTGKKVILRRPGCIAEVP